MLVAKGVLYFFLAIAVFVNVCTKGNTERSVTGLTLGIAIIEGSTALKDGIEKMKQYFENQNKQERIYSSYLYGGIYGNQSKNVRSYFMQKIKKE